MYEGKDAIPLTRGPRSNPTVAGELPRWASGIGPSGKTPPIEVSAGPPAEAYPPTAHPPAARTLLNGRC